MRYSAYYLLLNIDIYSMEFNSFTGRCSIVTRVVLSDTPFYRQFKCSRITNRKLSHKLYSYVFSINHWKIENLSIFNLFLDE